MKFSEWVVFPKSIPFLKNFRRWFLFRSNGIGYRVEKRLRREETFFTVASIISFPVMKRVTRYPDEVTASSWMEKRLDNEEKFYEERVVCVG